MRQYIGHFDERKGKMKWRAWSARGAERRLFSPEMRRLFAAIRRRCRRKRVHPYWVTEPFVQPMREALVRHDLARYDARGADSCGPLPETTVNRESAEPGLLPGAPARWSGHGRGVSRLPSNDTEAFLARLERSRLWLGDFLRTSASLGVEGSNRVDFENEAQARDWFAKHLEFFEPGLRLYDDGERDGVEFRCGPGRMRIDILALDRDGGFVVVETKMRGDDRAVAQLLRYMGWVRRNLAAEGQNVRGIVLVHEASEELLLAVKEIPNVRLVEYMHSLGVRWHA